MTGVDRAVGVNGAILRLKHGGDVMRFVIRLSLLATVAAALCLIGFSEPCISARVEGDGSPAAIGYVDAEGNVGLELVEAGPAEVEVGQKLAPTALEAEVITRINAERAANGVAPLVENGLITNAARTHSNDMATNDFFSHTGSDGSNAGQRLTAAGYNWTTYGENIAAGYATAADVVNAWMNSAGHRANILNPAFREIGVGYAYNAASTYGNYWTADFGTSPTSPTPVPIPTPGPTPVPGTNCINLAAAPLTLSPGQSVTLAYSILAQQYGFVGVPLNVYVAAIRDPLVIDAPSTVDQALNGGAVYIFRSNMSSAYLYTGAVGGPTFSNIVINGALAYGTIRVTVPNSSAYAGTYVFAAALINRLTGQFIRLDLPVDNSNSFTVQ